MVSISFSVARSLTHSLARSCAHRRGLILKILPFLHHLTDDVCHTSQLKLPNQWSIEEAFFELIPESILISIIFPSKLIMHKLQFSQLLDPR